MAKKTPKNKGEKLAVARDAAKMREVEERCEGIFDKIKHIRKGLEAGPIREVVLMLKTFELRLDEMEDYARKFKRLYDDAVDAYREKEGREARERVDQHILKKA
jgi:hypothetical protein